MQGASAFGFACNLIKAAQYLDALVHESFHHALFEAQQRPAAKYNHSQLAHAEHAGINLLQNGQHLLQQSNCTQCLKLSRQLTEVSDAAGYGSSGNIERQRSQSSSSRDKSKCPD